MDLAQQLSAVAHVETPYADYPRQRARSLVATSVSSGEYGRLRQSERPALAFVAALVTLATLAGTGCKRA